MSCRECGGRLKWIDTRHDADAIRRTYECASCKALWLAEERIVEASERRTLRGNSVYRGLAAAKG